MKLFLAQVQSHISIFLSVSHVSFPKSMPSYSFLVEHITSFFYIIATQQKNLIVQQLTSRDPQISFWSLFCLDPSEGSALPNTMWYSQGHGCTIVLDNEVILFPLYTYRRRNSISAHGHFLVFLVRAPMVTDDMSYSDKG